MYAVFLNPEPIAIAVTGTDTVLFVKMLVKLDPSAFLLNTTEPPTRLDVGCGALGKALA